MVRKWVRQSGAWVWCLLLLTAMVAAQSAASTGTISGAAVDPQGRVVAGAAVTVRSTASTAVRNATTDATGHFAVPLLAPGAYTVQVASGPLHLAQPLSVTLGVGTTVTLTLKLALAGTSQQVTVAGRGALVEGQSTAPPPNKESPGNSNAIAGLTVTYLPNRDRDFAQFSALAAGVDTSPGNDNPEVAGQRADDAKTEVDGADFDDPLEGGQRGAQDHALFFPQTVVNEFQIVHAGAGAEVGGTNAGFLNVATKSGSNTIRGEQFYILRPSGLTSNDAFGRSLDNWQNEFGGSVGGPIRKDKIFYYVGGEQDFLHTTGWTAFEPQAPGAPAIPAAIAALQQPNVEHNDPTAVFLRLDFLVNASNTLNLQSNYNRVQADNVNPGSSRLIAAPSALDSLAGQSLWLRGGLTTLFGSQLVNQVLGQWSTDRRDFLPNSTAPAVIIDGFGNLGGDPRSPHRYTSSRREFSDDVALNRGEHLLHLGIDFSYDPFVESHEADLNGRYDFNSLADYLAGTPRRFQQTFPDTNGSLLFDNHVQTMGIYVSDRWSVAEKVTLTAGMRWEGQWNPSPVETNPLVLSTDYVPNDLTQWEPRLGLAWNPDSKTTIRLSSGIYDAPTPATTFQRVFTDNGMNTVVADSYYDPSVLAAAIGGNGLAAPPSVTTPEALVVGVDPAFRNPRSFQAAGSVERQFSREADVNLGYVHNSTWALPRVIDANLDPPTIAANGMPVFPAARPIPEVGQELLNQSSAHSRYDGLLTTGTFRLKYNTMLVANYTFARTLDDASAQDPFGLVTALNPYDLANEAGYANQDMRHSFNLSATNNLPLGFKVNPVFVAHSGLPYTPIIGFDTQNDGNDFNDRAILGGAVAARNSLRQPAGYDLDLRFVKDITLKGRGHHLDMFMDIFNVTDAKNLNFGPEQISLYGTPAAPVYTAGTPLYAPATSEFGGPRQVQFTIRLVGF